MRPLHRPFALAAAAVTVAAALLLPAHAAHAQDTYLAIGDSWAFGYSTAAGTVRNTGYDPAQPAANGYVGLFAQTLDSRNGAAAAPTVVNLARPGEAFPTFNTSYTDTTGPNNNALYNERYLAAAAGGINPSQQGLLQATLGSALAPSITNVTIQLGGNDLLGLFVEAAWQNPFLTPQQRQALVTQRVNDVAGAMGTLLTNVRTALPGANIYVLGYADLFAAIPDDRLVNPSVPGITYGQFVKPYTAQATNESNIKFAQAVASVAAGVGGPGELEFVNLSADFPTAQLSDLSLILTDQGGTPNFHPSQQGYQVIANRLAATSAAAVPEAGTVGLLAAGSGGGFLLLASARRRRRAASALVS